MTQKVKIPTKAEFAKMPKAEQDKWRKWENDFYKKQPIVDPLPSAKKKKTPTKKTK